MVVRRKDDSLWKFVLEDVFDDFLRFFFPDADNLFDMRKGFEFWDKELLELYPEPGEKPDTGIVDKLVKVRLLDGKDLNGKKELLIHVEVQGQRTGHFSERMFSYYYRIFDRYEMPIMAIAIFTGQATKEMFRQYETHVFGTSNQYSYNIFHIKNFPDEDLLASENPFAMVVFAAKKVLLPIDIKEEEILEQKLSLVKILAEKRYRSERKKGVFTFIKNYILFQKKETNVIFEEKLNQLIGKIKTMGIVEYIAKRDREEGIKEGIAKEGKIFVEYLLSNTKFSIRKIASLAQVPISFVKKLKSTSLN